MRPQLRLPFISLALASVLVMPAFGASDLTLAALLPLTGPSAGVGHQMQEGIQFAADEINAKGGIDGHKLKINFDDDQAKPDQAVLALDREVQLNAVPVVITAYGVPTLAIAPLATRKKVLLLNAGAQSNKLLTASPYLFNTFPLSRDEAEVIARYAVQTLHKRSAEIIYEDSATGIDARDDFTQDFTRFGGKIAGAEPVEPGDTNFRPALLKAASTKPDVIFACIISDGSLPQFVTQMNQQKGLPIVIGGTVMTVAMGLPGTEGWTYTAIRGALAPDLEQRMKDKTGLKAISVFTREYYNATMIAATVAKGLADQGKPFTGDNFRTELMHIKNFDGVAKIRFDTNVAARDIDIMTVRGGHSVLVAKGVAGQ
jgi:branched-chain amino acid transport system substrate-binding protein